MHYVEPVGAVASLTVMVMVDYQSFGVLPRTVHCRCVSLIIAAVDLAYSNEVLGNIATSTTVSICWLLCFFFVCALVAACQISLLPTIKSYNI